MQKQYILIPHKNSEKKLLGLTVAERAKKMLEYASIVEFKPESELGDVVLYPCEIVGSHRLGLEIRTIKVPPSEILALYPQGEGRPVLLVSKEVFAGLWEKHKDPNILYQSALALLTKQRRLKEIAVPVERKEDLAVARKRLLGSLRKSVDGLISRLINRPISITLSSFLVHTPLTPNMLTVLTFCIAIFAAYMMALGNFITGAILMQFASIFDGCDGEVARLKYKSSSFGAWLDTILDDISTPLYILGTGYGLKHTLQPPYGTIFFALAIVSIVLSLPGYYVSYSRLIATGSQDAGRVSWSATPNPSKFRRFLTEYLQPLTKRDGYLFLFMLAAIMGFPWLIICMFFTGTVLVVGTIVTDKSPKDAKYGTTGQVGSLTASHETHISR
jgi:phosphatidylglycerophosphate synthase